MHQCETLNIKAKAALPHCEAKWSRDAGLQELHRMIILVFQAPWRLKPMNSRHRGSRFMKLVCRISMASMTRVLLTSVNFLSSKVFGFVSIFSFLNKTVSRIFLQFENRELWIATENIQDHQLALPHTAAKPYLLTRSTRSTMLPRTLLICILDLIAARTALSWNHVSKSQFQSSLKENDLALVACKSLVSIII